MAFTSKVLALVARVLGKQYNINIAMGNYRTASTDGKTIYIPLVKGEEGVNLARGYIDHEAAHIRLTDFNFQFSGNFKNILLNVIEDIRIEKAIGRDYPGCASNLRNLSTALNETHGVFEPNPVYPSSSILAWISCRGRVDTLSHDSMIASAQAAEPVARAAFGNHFAEAQRLVAMIGSLPEDKSGTAAAAKLRDEFMALLEQAKDDIDNQPEPAPQEEQETEENKDDQQDQSKDSDSSDDSGESDKSEGPDDSSKSESGESDEEGESGNTDNQDNQDGEEQEGSCSPSQSDSKDDSDSDANDSTDKGEEGAEGEGQGDTASGDADSEEGDDSAGDQAGGSDAGSEDDTDGEDRAGGASSNGGGAEGDDDGDDDSESQNKTQGSSAGHGPAEMQAIKETLEEALGSEEVEFGDVGQLLQELLQAEAVTDSAEIEEIPTLPICAPPRVRAADFPDLHLVKTHTAQLRAQLQGLIQASKLKRSIPRRVGRRLDNRTLTRLSVGDDRLFISREEKKGVNTAVLLILDGSGSMDYQVSGHKMHTATRACFVALETMYSIPGVTAAAVEFDDTPNTVFNLCGWGQKPDSKNFNHEGGGGTVLSTALWLGWGELLSRPETRKIAVIFSDGDTNFRDTRPTRMALRRMKQDGIELVGIGIQDNNLENYLPQETRVINDLKQLTPALLELLREKLVAA